MATHVEPVMKVIFARHGESEANVAHIISNRDLPHALTALGRQQSLQLADDLRDEGISALYCSPILRARETANLVGEQLHLTPVTVDGLREPDLGIIEGRGDDEAWRIHNELGQRWLLEGEHDLRLEGGESFNEIRRRFTAFIDELIARHGNTNDAVLCVAHGSVLLMMLPLVLPNVPVGYPWLTTFPNCATVVADYKAGSFHCLSWCGEAL
jgi:probable phosphoglycerate mutase